VPGAAGADRRGEGGFAPTFKEAVGRWRRRHRHPPPTESWFAVHYRVGWLVERLSFLESLHLLRQGLDVRSLAAERPARRHKDDGKDDGKGDQDAFANPDDESDVPEADPSMPVLPEAGRPPDDGG
jgi:hypothetical protein